MSEGYGNYFARMLSQSLPPVPSTDRCGTAVWFALGIARIWVTDGKPYIPHIDPDMKAVTQRFRPVREIVGRSEQAEPSFVGYEVDDAHPDDWQALFQSSPRAERYIREAISTNLVFGRTIPPGLLVLACRIVDGAVKPNARKTRRAPLTHRDTLLLGIARKVSDAFSVDLGASTATYQKVGTPPFRGCTVAAAALYGVGITRIVPKTANEICNKFKSLPILEAEMAGAFYPGSLPNENILSIAAALERGENNVEREAQWRKAMEYFAR
jgi:hypothetical protein